MNNINKFEFVKEKTVRGSPYLIFNGNCEETFVFYAEAFGGGNTQFARLDNNPKNPIMHTSVNFTKYDDCLKGVDVEEKVVIFGMAICVVLPTRQAIEEVSIKLAEGGKLVQNFTLHPVSHEKDGGAEVLDKFGFTWYLST
ncbi:MAG: VOC family protein [Anaerorhabdus sp.]